MTHTPPNGHPERPAVPPGCECPRCGEDDPDRLVWIDDDELVRCLGCETVYDPNRPGDDPP